MKAFVTGGTGFIGGRVVEHLLAAGHEVTALVRSEAAAAHLSAAGARLAVGDVCDPASLRAAMPGHDIVFHLAAWYKIGGSDWRTAETINVEGTRNVLSLAHELGIPKIIYTSSIAVFGDTKGKIPDETYRMPGSTFITEYDRTKWKAHYEVALPLIEQGAPVVILMPGAVYGPGDTSLVGDMLRYYSRGLLPVLPAPEMTLAFSHVDDIAQAHILAAEKGKPGESYILAGPVLNLLEASRIWSKVSGRPPPRAAISARLLTPLAPLARLLNRFLPLPKILSEDAARVAGVCYAGDAAKAKRDLGWQTRSVEEGMRETLAWISGQHSAPPRFSARQKQARGLILSGAAALILLWVFWRNRKG